MRKRRRRKWDDARVAKLREMLDRKLSFTEIAEITGFSRNAVASAVHRHIHGVVDERKHRGRHNVTAAVRAPRAVWTEEALTEPWAQRKFRKQLERQ